MPVELLKPHLIEPVRIEVVRECHFKAKACGICGESKSHANHSPKKTATCHGQWPRGCVRCGRAKSDPAHFGAPASFNAVPLGRGADAASHVGAGLLKTWRAILTTALAETSLPRPSERILAEGEITFPDYREDRDQGNFRVIIEKALGDALEAGGWLSNDDWSRYEFGNLTCRVVPGESATRLTLFPFDERMDYRPNEQLEIA